MFEPQSTPGLPASRFYLIVRRAADHNVQRLSLLCGIVLVALIATAHMAKRFVWGDEAITLLTLAGHSEPTWTNTWREFYGFSSPREILSALTWHDFHPPLYFWIAEFWRHFTGASLLAARSLSTLFVLASMVVAYLIAGRWQMKYRALPALLFGLSGVSLVYAATARQYALAELLILITIWCGDRRSFWTGVVAALAVSTHYYTVLAVGPTLAVQLITACKSQRRWSLSTALLFFLGIAALLPMLKIQAAARMAQYPETAPLLREMTALIGGEIVATFPLSSKLPIAVLSTLLVAACVFLGIRRSLVNKNFIPLLSFLAFNLFFFTIEHSGHNPLPDSFPIPYYLGFCVPPLVFLIGYGVEQRPPLALLLLLTLLVSTLTWTDRGFPLSTVGKLIVDIRSHCEGCVVVVSAVNGRGTAAALLYQLRDVPVFVLASPEDIPRLLAATSSAATIYFVPTSDTSARSLPETQYLQRFSHATRSPSGAYVLNQRAFH